MSKLSRALSDQGKYLLVGGSMSTLLWTLCFGALATRRCQRIRVLAVQPRQGLAKLFGYMQQGIVTPQLEHVYPLRDAR